MMNNDEIFNHIRNVGIQSAEAGKSMVEIMAGIRYQIEKLQKHLAILDDKIDTIHTELSAFNMRKE